MDVRLSPEQQALQAAAAQLVDRLGPHAVGQIDDPERVARLHDAVDASGWRELRAPLEGDAPLASGVEVGIVAEELGRGLADTPFLGPTLAVELRRLAGAPPAAGPETVVLTADLGELAVAPDGAVPEGAVAVDAMGAATALLLAPSSGGAGGWSLVQVELPGDGEAPLEPVDLTRRVVPVSGGVDPVPDAGRSLTDVDVSRWTALGLAIACADLVGTMRGAVDLSCDYAKNRRQYGVAIGSFQAVQHMLADAHVLTEGSRSAVLHAAWAVDALEPAGALAAGAVAKAYCARAARAVAETAIQVHGGIGNTWECMAHVYLRRALLSTDVMGGIGPNLVRVLEHRGIADHGLR